MKTTQEKIVAALGARGCKIVELNRRNGFVKMTKPEGHQGFYFIGPKGAIKAGECISRAISLTDACQKMLLLEAEKLESYWS